MPRDAVALLPPAPGVYRFRDAHQRILYIGRAANLRRRVGSYWTGLGDDRLHRVMPLAYAGDSLSGFEQVMARVRGVDPGARLALVETLTAVLDRDPPTVGSFRERLVSRRESAAQSLDFERAARIQAEIEGFDWVVAPQRARRAPLETRRHSCTPGQTELARLQERQTLCSQT
jgi:excinuclease UvrABC nuclease subunit